LGRQEGNEISLDDKKVSRKHAKVFREGDSVILEDMGSRNGTFVGEDRITRAVLRDGDVFRVGATKVRVRLEKPVTSTPEGASKSLIPEIPQVQLRETAMPRGGRPSTVEVKSGGKGRILQFHKIEDKGGLFSEDLSQRGGLFKAVLFLGLLALGAILFYFAFQMGSGGK